MTVSPLEAPATPSETQPATPSRPIPASGASSLVLRPPMSTAQARSTAAAEDSASKLWNCMRTTPCQASPARCSSHWPGASARPEGPRAQGPGNVSDTAVISSCSRPSGSSPSGPRICSSAAPSSSRVAPVAPPVRARCAAARLELSRTNGFAHVRPPRTEGRHRSFSVQHSGYSAACRVSSSSHSACVPVTTANARRGSRRTHMHE